MNDLNGRRALVTGAGTGIGRVIAHRLAESGARVIAVDYDAAAMESLTEGTTAADRLIGRVVDLADSADLAALCSEAERAPGIDILVNCAATYTPKGGFLTVTAADMTRVLQVNVAAAALLAASVARGLRSAGRGGSIVNFCGIQEELPVAGYGPYIATKGGIRAATGALAVELGPLGIRVNAVAPGVVNTPSTLTTLNGRSWGETEVPPTLLRRAGTPDEVASVVEFLVSDAASYVTGAVIPVDGGRRLSRRTDPVGDNDVSTADIEEIRP